MRSSKSIASVLGALGPPGIGATALIYAVTGASADASGRRSRPGHRHQSRSNSPCRRKRGWRRSRSASAEDEAAARLRRLSQADADPVGRRAYSGQTAAQGAAAERRGGFRGQVNEPRFDLHVVRKGERPIRRSFEVFAARAQGEGALDANRSPAWAWPPRRRPSCATRATGRFLAAGGSNAVGLELAERSALPVAPRGRWTSETRRGGRPGPKAGYIGWRKGPLQACSARSSASSPTAAR